MKKPFVMVFEGHDFCVAFWIPKTNEWVVYEVERLTGQKHYTVSRNIMGFRNDELPYEVTQFNSNDYYAVSAVMQKILANLKKDFGIENDFQTLYISPYPINKMGQTASFDYSIFNAPSWQKTQANHHEGHQWSAYIQAPFENAAILSWDAGGDNTMMMFSEVIAGNMNFRAEYPAYRCSYVWNLLGSIMPTIKTTLNPIDVAGKMMGLSAYGYENEDRARELAPQMKNWMQEHKGKRQTRREIVDWVNEVDADEPTLALAAQFALEEVIVDLIRNEWMSRIEACDNNLIITGGTAMNILANERIKQEFPQLNVFVPCNPGDSGIACGLLHHEFQYTEEYAKSAIRGDYDFKYAGPYLFDRHRIRDFCSMFNGEETTFADVAQLLRQGKIIGFLNGRSEVGPRALGNRSILCDPSQPDMKNALNAKVKFREWYRPFAPVCKLEDADKYFDSRDYHMMDSMQFGIKVKPEWKDHLTEITHADGTARLQTVTRESNPIFYELLDEFDGVLLNTSFNVQGKPILNTIKDALGILRHTELDHLVVVHEEKPYIFS